MYCAVFIGCITAVTRCHSLLFVVTRCHSLSLVAPLVVTRCTTRLSFYKRSMKGQWQIQRKEWRMSVILFSFHWWNLTQHRFHLFSEILLVKFDTCNSCWYYSFKILVSLCITILFTCIIIPYTNRDFFFLISPTSPFILNFLFTKRNSTISPRANLLLVIN